MDLWSAEVSYSGCYGKFADISEAEISVSGRFDMYQEIT